MLIWGHMSCFFNSINVWDHFASIWDFLRNNQQCETLLNDIISPWKIYASVIYWEKLAKKADVLVIYSKQLLFTHFFCYYEVINADFWSLLISGCVMHELKIVSWTLVSWASEENSFRENSFRKHSYGEKKNRGHSFRKQTKKTRFVSTRENPFW